MICTLHLALDFGKSPQIIIRAYTCSISHTIIRSKPFAVRDDGSRSVQGQKHAARHVKRYVFYNDLNIY